MATVEKGLMNPHTEMQQGNAVNSTLNFMPAVPSWSVLPAAHDHSYATIWEQPAASSTHHGEGQGGGMSCINLMGRMAYVDGNPGGGFNIMEGNLDWMAAKYTTTNHENNNNHNNYDDDDHTSSAKVNNVLRHHDLNLAGRQEMHYLEHPVSPQEEADEAVSSSPSPSAPSSCLLHHSPSPPSALLFKRQGVLHPHHSPLLKKHRSSSSSPKETCSKEDPPASNGSPEVGPALNTNGRPRAKRGSATDPQSVYARQRRERINERLKILQNLVPNGAKVDIVTMLEEAISYVKFLQLQVKLLSSDEYWMYAPTTYNGIDVSFDMLQHSS